MNGRFLLDSNAVIALIADNQEVIAKIADAEAFLSVTVLGELYYGARKSGRVKENIARLDQLVEAFQVIGLDLLTARLYGEIRDELRRSGRPIPENDIWISATANQHRLTVLLRDAHFKQVIGLALQDW